MPTSVTMPRLGESVTEGTVTRWLKAEGEHVDADEPLLEVSTDKVDTEVPSPASGTLLSIKVQEDETVEIGVELAVIGEAGEDAGRRRGRGDEPEQAAEAGHRNRSRPRPRSPSRPGRRSPSHSAEPEPERTARARAGPRARPEPRPRRRRPRHPRRHPPRLPRPRRPRPGPAARPTRDDEEVAGTYVTPLVRKLAAEHDVDLARDPGHRGRRPDPQVRRAGRRRRQPRRPSRRPPDRPSPSAPRRGRAPRGVPPRRARRRGAAARAGSSRCRGCGRSSPPAWSSRCRPPHS